jgi:hypothetical protein
MRSIWQFQCRLRPEQQSAVKDTPAAVRPDSVQVRGSLVRAAPDLLSMVGGTGVLSSTPGAEARLHRCCANHMGQVGAGPATRSRIPGAVRPGRANLASRPHQEMRPNPAREVVLETDADPRLPRQLRGNLLNGDDYANGVRLHAGRRMALDEAHLCTDREIHSMTLGPGGTDDDTAGDGRARSGGRGACASTHDNV